MDFKAKPFEKYVEMEKLGLNFPAPFDNLNLFPDWMKVPEIQNRICLRPAMTKAFLILLRHYEVERCILHLSEDRCVTEYSEVGDVNILFQYDTSSGMKGVCDVPMVGKQTYELHSNTDKDATALWVALIAYAEAYSERKSELVNTLAAMDQAIKTGNLYTAWEHMARLQYYMYEVVTGANSTLTLPNLEWKDKQAAVELLTDDPEVQGLVEHVIYGESIIGCDSTSTKKIDVFVPNDPKEVVKMHDLMKRSVTDYTPWEKAMIPSHNPKYAETEIDVDIVNTISRTWGKDQDMQVKNFAFFGPAGSGKSAAEEHLASLLQIPFSRQMCSSGDDETSLFGTIIPVVEGMKEKLNGESKVIAEVLEMSDGKIELEKIAEAIGFPSPQICMFDKDAALEMMGIVDSGEPIMDQRRKAIEDKVKAITQGNEGKEGVSYKYIPSPLVTGIENGHMVAIEEPTNVFNQGIFSCLYDVLDRNSAGIIRTPIGTITRHPDFICMLSSNTSYTGNRDLPGPLKSRFQFLAHFKEPDETTLTERVMKKIGAAEEFKNKVLQCVQAYKKGNERAKDLGQSADYEATPRALFCFADAVIDGIEPVTAYKQYVLPHLANEQEDLDAIWDGVSDSPIFWQK